MFSRYPIAVLILTASFFLASCGDGGGGSSGSSSSAKSFTYNMTDSAGNLQVGRRAVVIHRGLSGSCASITGTTTGILHTVDSSVSVPGSVILKFSVSFSGPYLESIYIDMDGNNLLSYGDMVWGFDHYDLAGACIDNKNIWTATQYFDWTDDVAIVLGSTVYWGGTETYSMDGESDIPAFGESYYFGEEGYAPLR